MLNFLRESNSCECFDGVMSFPVMVVNVPVRTGKTTLLLALMDKELKSQYLAEKSQLGVFFLDNKANCLEDFLI